MTTLYMAGEALGLNQQQVEALVFFWNLPELAQDETKLRDNILARRLLLSEYLIAEFLKSLRACRVGQDVDLRRFCQTLWQESSAMLEATALLLYFQQLYFTKTSIVESSTQSTPFVIKYQDEITALANTHFDMIAPRDVTRPAAATLLIGATAETCRLYLEQFKAQSARHSLGKLFIFLSTRPLGATKSDNPVGKVGFDIGSQTSYGAYLEEHYLTRYNHLMTGWFGPKFKPTTTATEGLVMLHQYELIFEQPFERACAEEIIYPVYTGYSDSYLFYEECIKLGLAKEHFSDNHSVALGSIQPYLPFFEKQFSVVCQSLSQGYRDKPMQDLLACLQGTAYGIAGSRDASILAQRLAAMIDLAYNPATQQLKTRLQDNLIPLPKEYLRPNYSKKPLVFLCSSLGDTELAKDTIRNISSKSDRSCVIIPLSPTAAASIVTFANENHLKSNITAILTLNDRPLYECDPEHIVRFINEELDCSHAFVGLPSQIHDELAMQIALRLKITVTLANEFMFEPPEEHAFWKYQDALIQKNNLQCAVPLRTSSMYRLFPNAHVIGHLSLKSIRPMDQDRKRTLKQQLLAENARLTLVSGTTQPPGFDLVFLNALFDELPNHPNVALRYSIHPGTKEDMMTYIEQLIHAAEKKQVDTQFKIILNDRIKQRLNYDNYQRLLASHHILDINISGPDAAAAADAVTQAVQGALVNEAAISGKPSFAPKHCKPLLPGAWYAESIHALFTQEAGPAHHVSEVHLSAEVMPGEAVTRLMMG